MPSIHMHHHEIHLDTANWKWGYGLGFLIHLTIDMGLNNLNPTVPQGH